MTLVRLSGQPREQWFANRKSRVSSSTNGKRNGRRLSVRSLRPLHRSKPAIIWLLRACGLLGRGMRNACQIRLEEYSLEFDELPAAFDSMSILLITDFHAGGPVDVCQQVSEVIRGKPVDLCILGGDYSYDEWLEFSEVRDAFRQLLRQIESVEGVIAILGNNDRAEIAKEFENLGVTTLVNETYAFTRGDERILITGTDDPHYFYTPSATHVLTEAFEGFRIALVHSVELADEAAQGNCDLYLAGHSHGGQVCLPGGIPLLTRVRKHRDLARGHWSHKGMTGYTSRGAGVSGVPVRFNCRGEVALITLRRRATSQGSIAP